MVCDALLLLVRVLLLLLLLVLLLLLLLMRLLRLCLLALKPPATGRLLGLGGYRVALTIIGRYC